MEGQMKKEEIARHLKDVTVQLGRLRESKVVADGEKVELRRECEAASVALVYAHGILAGDIDAADDDPRDAAETILQACVSMMFDGGDDDE
jgi:cell division septum initiation protein DivIVA